MTIRKETSINHVTNNPNDRVKIVFNCRKTLPYLRHVQSNFLEIGTFLLCYSSAINHWRFNVCQWLMSLSFFYYKLNLKNNTIKPKTSFVSFVDLKNIYRRMFFRFHTSWYQIECKIWHFWTYVIKPVN
jgi:hypothetical protein